MAGQLVLTEAMIDAPRGFLGLYGLGGGPLRTARARAYCEAYQVGSTRSWPSWALQGDVPITKAGAAILVFSMMVAAR